MAIVTAGRVKQGNVNVQVWKWIGLASGDVGSPVQMPAWSDRSAQVVGNFGSASIPIEGSIDGVNYKVLTDPQGNALNFSSAGIEAISELVLFIRPGVNTGGGGATAIDVWIIMAGRVAS